MTVKTGLKPIYACIAVSVCFIASACAGHNSFGGLSNVGSGFWELCTVGNANVEVKLMNDIVKNTSTQEISLTGLQLDRSDNAQIIDFSFPKVAADFQASAPYDGNMTGPRQVTLAPGEEAFIEVALRAVDPQRIGRADGLLVQGIGLNGSKAEVHTCTVLGASPASLKCSPSGTYEGSDGLADVEYMEHICP